MALLDLGDARLFITDVDALAARVLVVPGELFPLPQRAHHGAEAFGPRDQRDIRLAIGDEFGGMVHEHLGRVAAGRSVAGLCRVRAEHVGERLRRVRVAPKGKTRRVRAVGDEADGGDVVDGYPELLAEASVGGGGFRRIRHQMHWRLRLLDILFLLDELAAAHQHGHAIVELDVGH